MILYPFCICRGLYIAITNRKMFYNLRSGPGYEMLTG